MAMQYRSQCENRYGRKVLSSGNDVGSYPGRIVTHKEEGRTFYREDPMVVNDLVWAIVVLTRGTNSGEVDEKLEIEESRSDP